MKQDAAASKATELLLDTEIINIKDYNFVFTLAQQLFAIGYDAGRPLRNKERAVLQQDRNNNNIKVHDSASIASRRLNINKGSIAAAAAGKRRTAGGYCWKYVDETSFNASEETIGQAQSKSARPRPRTHVSKKDPSSQ